MPLDAKARPTSHPRSKQKQNAERLANAKQIICFAQLRAKNIEKDLQNPPETTGNHEKVIFWDTENFNIFTPVTDLSTGTSTIDTSSEDNF